MMKKNHLIFALLMLIATPVLRAHVNPTNEPETKSVESVEETEISRVRQSLIVEGYTDSMMNDLFGNLNRFFPSTDEKLQTSIFMVDLLVQNGVYSEDEKQVLIFLAFEAHEMFNKDGAQ